MSARDRVLQREPILRRARGQANLVRSAALQRVALARGEAVVRGWPRGFDDPWDQAGAGRIMRRYRPPGLAAPVVLTHTHLSETQTGRRDLGWQRHIAGTVTTRPLPGDHLTMFTAPDVQELGAALADELGTLDLHQET